MRRLHSDRTTNHPYMCETTGVGIPQEIPAISTRYPLYPMYPYDGNIYDIWCGKEEYKRRDKGILGIPACFEVSVTTSTHAPAGAVCRFGMIVVIAGLMSWDGWVRLHPPEPPFVTMRNVTIVGSSKGKPDWVITAATFAIDPTQWEEIKGP